MAALRYFRYLFDGIGAGTCNNYPATFLRRIQEARGKDLPTLVWALDGDAAGRDYTQRWVKRARKDGWTCEAATIPQTGKSKQDWNDLHLADKLLPSDIDDYRYQGALLIARNHADKARLIFRRTSMATFFYDFADRLYWFDLDIRALDKAMQQLEEKDPDQDEQARRDQALVEACENVEIANCNPQPLYYQANTVTDESWYYYRVSFPHGGGSVKNTFAGSSLASASEFKKRLLSIAPGAVFTGTSQQLDRIIQRQLFNIKTVDTIDFVGYSKEHGVYVMGDIAIKDGVVHTLNDEDYFELAKLNLKTLSQSPQLTFNRDRREYRAEWLDLVWQCFGAKGLVALAFWFGSLFAEQIRQVQKSYPFLELVGEAGAGKSTLIEFMWKLFGRRDYEGFDPSKSTSAARARNFAQVSNLPVVLIESDRDDDAKKRFDWDELKTAYNGRSVRATGVKNSGNETRDPRVPELITMRAVIALWRRRGSLPSRSKGSLSPYLWAVAEIAYRCRMRNVEVRKLSDADALPEGVYVDRVKGSRDNVTRWIPALREAWDFLAQRRNAIWAKRRKPVPLRAEDRPLIIAEDGARVSKEALKSAWARGIEIAMEAKLITDAERFGLHGLKHRGITDTAGTPDKKQQASGHIERRMVYRYDHEVPLVEPAGEAADSG